MYHTQPMYQAIYLRCEIFLRYWWLAYDAIKNMTVTTNLPQILAWPVRLVKQHVSVPSLKLFGLIKTELWAKEI